MFILLLIIFPLGELIRLPFFGGFPLLDVCVGVLILWILVKSIVSKTTIKQWSNITMHHRDMLIAISAFILACLLSLILQSGKLALSEFFISSLYIIRWVAYTMVYFIVAGFPRQVLLKKYVLICGSITIFFGYIQYFFYPDLRNLYYAGWDPHLYRMFGTFFDPNFMGAIIALFILFVLGLVSKREIQRNPGVGLLCFSFPALLLTYSRSAFLMAGIGIIVLLLLAGYRKLIWGICIAGLLCILVLSLVSKYSEGTNLLRTVSTNARIESSQQAIKLFRQSPIFGIGFNSYRYAQDRTFPSCTEKKVQDCLDKQVLADSHAGAGTDNSFLFVLATTGIVGFTAYIFLWYKIILTSWNHKTEPYGLIVFSSSLALCANSLFINSLFYPFIMLWMWAMIGTMRRGELN